MTLRKKKFGSSLLVFVLILSLVFPISSLAAAKEVVELKSLPNAEAISSIKEFINQQTRLIDAPYLDESLENLSNNEEITVIVELSSSPVALMKGISLMAGKEFTTSAESAVKKEVESQHQTFEKALRQNGLSAQIVSSYSYAINAVAVKIKSNQVKDLLKIKGVKAVYANQEYTIEPPSDEVSPHMGVSGPYIGAPDIWDLGFQGEGIKVGVIDTGIDYLHPDLKDAYAGGWDFVNNDADPYETMPSELPPDMPPVKDGRTYWTDHGTHVAGTIAARGVGKYGVKGIAPKAIIYAYKVLGPYGSGQTAWVLGGIDKAVKDGMDVINLSLGNSLNDPDYVTSVALNNAMLAGVVAVTSNGNSGPDRWTVGSPGTSTFAISVGNSTVPSELISAKGNFTVISEVYGTVTSEVYDLKLMAWDLSVKTEEYLTGNYEVVDVGLGNQSDFEGKDLKGKIALIKRGAIPFVDKIANAKNANAIATIIYNSNPGFIEHNLGNNFDFIPTFNMKKEDGEALSIYLKNNNKIIVSFSNYQYDQIPGDDVNSSSSRGPVQKTLNIKPDVVAPGTNILSSVPAYGKENPNADYSKSYDRFTGTSMASPHVAGLAALLVEKYPNWTPFDIKVALMNNAKVLDPTKYDVFDQGAGRVQGLQTLETKALAKVVDKTTYKENGIPVEKENITGSINFGFFTSDYEGTVEKNVIVQNLTGSPSDYTVTVNVYHSIDGVSIDVDHTSFTLDKEQTLLVKINVPKGITAEGELQGYITISNDTTHLSIPFVAYFNKLLGLKGIKYISTYPEQFSPNEDGVQDTADIAFEFHNPMNLVIIELFDGLDFNAGPGGDGYIGQIYGATGLFNADKRYVLSEWYGEYYDYELEDLNYVKDGLYTLDITSRGTDGKVYVEDTNPIFVKRNAPKINLPDQQIIYSSTLQLSGNIEDLYLESISALKEGWDIDLILNEVLDSKFELVNTNNSVIKSGTFNIDQNGSFNISVNNLPAGSYKLNISIADLAGNIGTKTIDIEVKNSYQSETPSSGGYMPVTSPTPSVSTGVGTLTTTKNADGTTSATLGISSNVVNNQLQDQKASTVTLNLSDVKFADYKEVAVTLDKSTADKLLASGKEITLTAGGFEITIPSDALADFISGSGFKIILSVSEAGSGTVQVQTVEKTSIVSPVVTVQSTTGKLNKPIKITLKPTAKLVADARKVGAYEKTEDGKWAYVGANSVRKDGNIELTASKLGSYAAIEYRVTFADIENHWAKDEIEVIAAQHVTTGKSETEFAPNDTITRAEFIALLDRILGAEKEWSQYAAMKGATDVLGREEMVVLMVNALDVDLSGVKTQLSFKDQEKISADARAAVAFAVNNGLIKGVDGNKFAPEQSSSRSQVAVILYRLMQFMDKI